MAQEQRARLLVELRLDRAAARGVGARDADGPQDAVDGVAAAEAGGDGALRALAALPESVVAGRAEHVPGSALEHRRPEGVEADGAVESVWVDGDGELIAGVPLHLAVGRCLGLGVLYCVR